MRQVLSANGWRSSATVLMTADCATVGLGPGCGPFRAAANTRAHRPHSPTSSLDGSRKSDAQGRRLGIRYENAHSGPDSPQSCWES
jgi:hypothetical protein